MAQADLECYDENGYATLTAATLFGRVLAEFNTGTTDGSRYLPGLTTGGAEPWYFSSPVSGGTIRTTPRFTIANDTISWTFVDYSIGNSVIKRVGLSVVVGID